MLAVARGLGSRRGVGRTESLLVFLRRVVGERRDSCAVDKVVGDKGSFSVSPAFACWKRASSEMEMIFRRGGASESRAGLGGRDEDDGIWRDLSEELEVGRSGTVAQMKIVPSAATVTSLFAVGSAGLAGINAMSVTPSVCPQSLASRLPSSE